MRSIDELIWHCSATPEGREVSAEEIDRWHRDRGWSGIGYHKIVHLDGSVSEGRSESRQGAHVAGHNSGTIGYVYIGGVDADMQAKDTRTKSQRETMERLTREAIDRYDLAKVSGHREYAAKACPSFDATAAYAPLLTDQPAGGTGPALGADVDEVVGGGRVTASSLNLRREPDGDIVGAMPEGTSVRIHGGDGNWLWVTTPAGYTGWAHRAHIATDLSAPDDAPAPDSDDSLDRAAALMRRALDLLESA